jgi:hypothetical protein
MIYYCDSSAIAKIYLEESGSVFIELLRKNYHNREDFKRQNNGSAE